MNQFGIGITISGMQKYYVAFDILLDYYRYLQVAVIFLKQTMCRRSNADFIIFKERLKILLSS